MPSPTTSQVQGWQLRATWFCLPHSFCLVLCPYQLECQASVHVYALRSWSCHLCTGSLPAGWAQQAKQLYNLDLSFNRDLVGEIPSAWDSANAFPSVSGADRFWTTGL